MSMRHFALLLGLTTTGTATLLAPLPTRAASCETGDLFDFSSIQFIATRPIASNNCLRLFGKRTDPTPQGFVGYRAGHTETALN